MMQRIRRPFTVTSVADDRAWLKLLEGRKRGLEFVAYADSDMLAELNEGSDLEVTLISENSQGTRWRIEDYKSLNARSQQSPMPAGD